MPISDRKNYGRLKEIIPIPDLISIQTQSYADFLQLDTKPEERRNQGLEEVLRDAFPPREKSEFSCGLVYRSYSIDPPKIGIVDCLKDGGTYQGTLKVTFELKRPNTREVLVETLSMGDIPLMTDRGSFVINGAERVIVSQLHRSPGVCFEETRHASGKNLYSFRIIADHGSWLEVHFDINDYMYIYLDRKRRRRKFLISTFLRAFGFDNNRDILDAVYGVEELTISKLRKVDDLSQYYSAVEILGKGSDEVIIPALESLTEEYLDAAKEAKVSKIPVVATGEIGDYFVKCVQKDSTVTCLDAQKEIYKRMRPSDPVTDSNAKALFKRLFEDVRRYDLGYVGRFKLNQCLGIDIPADVRILTKTDIAAATRRLMALRNGHGTKDDIDHLGRRRIRTVGELLQNQCRLGLARTANMVRERLNSSEGLEKGISYLVNPKTLAGFIRDFFSRNQLSQFMDQTNCLAELTNKRRLSALGPGGLTRDRAGYDVRDVHSSHYGRICPIETPEGPNIGLISSLALYGRIDNFGFIQTPYCRVHNGVVGLDVKQKGNKIVTKDTGEVINPADGVIEYGPDGKAKVFYEVDYLTADKEEEFVIAQANAPLDANRKFINPTVLGTHIGESAEFPSESVQYIDISPKQLISAAAGLIPFLEHDDANRALMGSNMQRQAVPLLKPERPLVGTGLEHIVARDSRAIVTATHDGIVASATAEEIYVTADGLMPAPDAPEDSFQHYILYKFLRSNASTLVNQHPIVKKGDHVRVGQTLADSACTDQGELALGRNVMVAFMPWNGYNFEDAIIISEKLVQEDTYSSIHISLEDVTARETKLGAEEITRDIPNAGEDALRNLDTEGVIRIGSEVKPGDFLVGKITPKNKTELAPEERLLKAIFGEKAADVKDTSLLAPGGCSGMVMDIRLERKIDYSKAKSNKADLKLKQKDTENKYKNEHNAIIEDMVKMLSERFLGQKLPVAVSRKVDGQLEEIIPAERKITKMMLNRLAHSHENINMKECEEKNQIDEIIRSFRTKLRDNQQCKHEALALLLKNEGNDPGKIVAVKVYIASKRRISVGDKMAGRHGNKGIVAKIVPVADLPFMADGTPVDIILNPLGVPSRMNVGQVFETHAGWAAKILGIKIATPVFDGLREDSIIELLEQARRIKVEEMGWTLTPDKRVLDQHGRDRTEAFIGLDGKTRLYDGRTGEPFAQRAVVGQIYMLKLDHLVVNKIHARAVGPYSLVTQQPLGGKAQHGGQRFGEMEVWALEAYGAAYTLQEMLTVKSDDVSGRTKIYDSIMQGKNELEAGIPESFNVLLREMMSLCLDVRIRRTKNTMA
ncbi:MAG: DNA-directed RNA polymerase subunit beta [Lentisphaerae bacterium]|nr:DNA-directed RNA polymerase subunit beta [Lentisphaerota bacterium]